MEFSRRTGAWKNQVYEETCNRWFFQRYKKKSLTKIQKLRLPTQNVEEASSAPAAMCRVAHSYYSKLYSPEETDPAAQESLLSLIDNKFNIEAQNILNTLLTIEELEDALKSMGNDKAPGPDELSPVFYKMFSDVTLPLILNTFNEAFDRDVFSAELAEGQIVLLYKKDDSTLMKNYCLITLLNVDYKIVTKALAKRFSKVLADGVGPFQHAFIPGRRATDCAMALNLVYENLKINNKDGIILSLDMEKAYDRVYHKWLFKVLDKLEAGQTVTR
jgi:hypothetical protein